MPKASNKGEAMTDQERKKINHNLLKWAGFEPAPGCKKGCHVVAPPPSYKVIETPDFTRSVDAIIEWLSPKLKNIVVVLRPKDKMAKIIISAGTGTATEADYQGNMKLSSLALGIAAAINNEVLKANRRD